MSNLDTSFHVVTNNIPHLSENINYIPKKGLIQ